MKRFLFRRIWICILVSCCVLRAAAPAVAAARTPAEVEARRAAIAGRLGELADEDAQLACRLAGFVAETASGLDPGGRASTAAERAEAEHRRTEVAEERVALMLEADALAAVVTRNATGPLTPVDPIGLAVGQQQGSTSQVGSGNAFNPVITVIPDGLYTNDTRKGTVPGILAAADGFGANGAGESKALPRGFSLREVEVAFSGAVDPYFDVWATFGIADGQIEAEEVYIQTRRLLPGVQVRAGQFFSGIGYLNRQHRHQWDFVDQALPYEALLGSRLEEAGVQVTWLPALPVYLQLGFEALQGDNPLLSNQLAAVSPSRLDETPGPRIFTGFAKLSPDLGFDHTVQLGVSVAHGRSHQETLVSPFGSADNRVTFDGSTWLLATEAIWRYDSSRPSGQGDLTVVGEYLYRSKALASVDRDIPALLDAHQDGLYAQAVYGVVPRWTVGARVEAIGLQNRWEAPSGRLDFEPSSRYSADLTFNPTEFSRLRLQYNHGRVWNERRVTFHQLYVQFQMSLGVHGAHRF